MPLAHCEERLRRHFAELRRQRTATVGEKPIFALEHGLNTSEIEELAAAIRADVAQAPPDKSCPLPWVVYAAELGYRYSGDEYWQSFEEHTPGWRLFGDRQWIRTCYRKFQSTYGGAQPSGPWAAHFSIICWPITHAILPRDLQRQLAQIVYDLRFSFSAELFDAPERLGVSIRARSWGASSRFQQLVEDPQLVGQIATALLLQGQYGTSGLIDPLTLQRISNDLDTERRSREWLRGARRLAQERAKVRGLMPGTWREFDGEREVERTRLERAREDVAALGIEPRLVLRPGQDGATWKLNLEVPDLSHLLIRFPETRDVLTGSRCVVAGSAGRPLPRGYWLHGVRHVTLARWPGHDEVLLKFERTSPQLEYLLRTECLLRPGPTWLFRVASDGLAYELRGHRVRPGHRYIAIRTEGPFAACEHATKVDIECSNVHAVLLDVPEAVTSDWENTLRHLGLLLTKTIEVWPAGLDALAWDGEGHGEWSMSESPCLAIRVDHEVDALVASLDATDTLAIDLAAAKPGEPVFVQLPPLAVGRHTMRLSARATSSKEAEPVGDLEVVMRVRETPTWLGPSPHGPLVVEIDPTAPSLEQFWEGRVDVWVRGPAGRQVKCLVTLSDKDSAGPPTTKDIPPINLPITAEQWRAHFDSHVRRSQQLSRAYDTAATLVLQFTGDDLGAFEIRCERDFTPLRWVVRRTGQRHSARLIDDSGDPVPLHVVRMGFKSPSREEPLDGGPVYDVPAPGGLYVARRQQDSAAVIIPPSAIGLSLRDLGCVPQIEVRGRSIEDVFALIALARAWGMARLPGNVLAIRRRRDVIRAFAREIFRIIGGDAWAKAEIAAENDPGRLEDLKRAVSRKAEERGIAAGLSLDHEGLAHKPCEQRVKRLADSATTFRLVPRTSGGVLATAGNVILRGRPANEQDPVWLAELALRLASAPSSVEDWANQALRSGLARLIEVPTLARAARFLVLAIDSKMSARATQGDAYAGWGWP